VEFVFSELLIFIFSKKNKDIKMLNISCRLLAALSGPQGPYCGELCNKPYEGKLFEK
jgi:hypothetical protein